MLAPNTIPMPGQEKNQENINGEIITAYVKHEKVMLTPLEAISLINQISGVLLAHEYNQSSKS